MFLFKGACVSRRNASLSPSFLSGLICENVRRHRHSPWFLVKGKEIWLLPPDKNTEESSRPENNNFFFFFPFFVVIWACQIGLLSALQVCGRHRRGCWDKEWGREEREVKKTFGLEAWCMGGRERNGRGSVVLVCKSLQQIRRNCGRSETLSLDAAVVNILAWFRS